jgi:Spy/CpxP family protein refolding chaperone
MKSMRKVVLVAIFLLGAVCFAQQNPPAQPPPGGDQTQGPRRGMPSVDDQLKMLSDRLKLTADQQAKIKPVLEDQRTQMQALMKDDSLSQDDRRAKMRSVRDSTNSKIRDVLTDDQKKQFDEMQQQMRDRMRGQQPGGQNPPPK